MSESDVKCDFMPKKKLREVLNNFEISREEGLALSNKEAGIELCGVERKVQ
jgi:hypothetical protein